MRDGAVAELGEDVGVLGIFEVLNSEVVLFTLL
jgi:hypothetical protein